MPRRLRIEFEGAIYHVIAGNARQKIVRDDGQTPADRRLEQSVVRQWLGFAVYVVWEITSSDGKTRAPTSVRMQSFLSGYAIWAGDVGGDGPPVPGAVRAEMIEDETYYWTVSRYNSSNRALRVWCSVRTVGVVELPRLSRRQKGASMVAHDELLAAWRGDHGGPDARQAYARFVKRGWSVRPIAVSRGLWRVGSGSERFLARLRSLAGSISQSSVAEARQLSGIDPKRIFAPSGPSTAWTKRRCRGVMTTYGARGRGLALPPAHRSVTTRARRVVGTVASDSVPNLTRRIETR